MTASTRSTEAARGGAGGECAAAGRAATADRRYGIALALAVTLTLSALGAASGVRRSVVLGAYSSSLEGRTPSQIHNASRAAAALNGTVLKPGAQFSFAAATGPWTIDRGYRKAPVSHDGELIRSFGGGVCQTSSTLYCAALVAGMQVTQRQRHTWPARYVPPGGDAAVAPQEVDLGLRNTHPFEVRMEAQVQGSRLVCRFVGLPRGWRSLGNQAPPCRVLRQVTDVVPPPQVRRMDPAAPHGSMRILKRGQPGYRVRTLREVTAADGTVGREFISEDSYPPMSRVIAVGTGEGGKG